MNVLDISWKRKKNIHPNSSASLFKLTSVCLLTAQNKRQTFRLQAPDRLLSCYPQIIACKGCIPPEDYLWWLPQTEMSVLTRGEGGISDCEADYA